MDRRRPDVMKAREGSVGLRSIDAHDPGELL